MRNIDAPYIVVLKALALGKVPCKCIRVHFHHAYIIIGYNTLRKSYVVLHGLRSALSLLAIS